MFQKTGVSKLKKAKITAAKERAAAMFKVGYNPQQYTYHSPELSDSEDEYQVSQLKKELESLKSQIYQSSAGELDQ